MRPLSLVYFVALLVAKSGGHEEEGEADRRRSRCAKFSLPEDDIKFYEHLDSFLELKDSGHHKKGSTSFCDGDEEALTDDLNVVREMLLQIKGQVTSGKEEEARGKEESRREMSGIKQTINDNKRMLMEMKHNEEEINNWKKEREELLKSNEEIRNENKKIKKELQEIMNANEKLKEENVVSQKEIDKIQKKKEEYRNKIEELQTKQTEIMNQNEKLQNENHESTNKTEELQNKRNRILRENESLKKENKQIMNQREERTKTKVKENQGLKKENEEFRRKYEELKNTALKSRLLNPRDCSDILANGESKSGVYTIYPSSCVPLSVFCDLQTGGGGWTVFLARMNQSRQLDFKRNWEDYKNGFGSPDSEYWLGNEHLHTLTSARNYSVRLEAEDYEGSETWGEWNAFRVESEKNKYKLNVGDYNMESLAHRNQFDFVDGGQFSALDQDNDDWDSDACSQLYNGGWWYNYCSVILPTSVHGHKDWNGIRFHFWTQFDRNDAHYVHSLRLKIKPVE